MGRAEVAVCEALADGDFSGTLHILHAECVLEATPQALLIFPRDVFQTTPNASGISEDMSCRRRCFVWARSKRRQTPRTFRCFVWCCFLMVRSVDRTIRKQRQTPRTFRCFVWCCFLMVRSTDRTVRKQHQTPRTLGYSRNNQPRCLGHLDACTKTNQEWSNLE